MAYRTYFPLRGVNFHEPVWVGGSFTPDLNTTYPHNVPLTQANGAKFTVTKTAAGTYVVTFVDPYLYMIEGQSQFVGQKPFGTGPTGVSLQLAMSSYGYPAANQIQLRFYNPQTALVASDITAVEPASIPVGGAIDFSCLFKVTKSTN